MKWRWWQLDFIITLALVVVCSGWFLYNHAWGAWGDDTPGYVYTASQIIRHQPLVDQDPLVHQALQWFGQERLARFVAPAHHEIISPSGWTASRYPIGLGLLMAIVAGIARWDLAIYLVIPSAAVIVVILTYWCAVVWLPLAQPFKRLAGIMAAVSVMFCGVFANYAVAEPMREIPSMAFFLASFLCVAIVLQKWCSSRWVRPVVLILAGFLYGYSVAIRETSIILFPTLVWLFFYTSKQNKPALVRRWFLLFCTGLIVAGSISIWTAVTITQHKEKFRDKDLTNIAITANFDHIQSLSLKNLYDNQGKFRPGVGGINQYWQVMQQFSVWPPFLLMAFIGILLLYRKDKPLALFFLSWFVAIFFLFAMWINPYPRYILPLLPVVALLSAYGTLSALEQVTQLLQVKKPIWLLLHFAVVGSFFLTQYPALQDRQAQISNPVAVYKGITYQDTITIKEVAAAIDQHAQITGQPPLLLMLGTYKGGLAETIMSQTDLRVIRFPGKPNEQPPLGQFTDFINELRKTSSLVIWYDATTSSTEQDWLQRFSIQSFGQYNFSFQEDITLYAITNHN